MGSSQTPAGLALKTMACVNGKLSCMQARSRNGVQNPCAIPAAWKVGVILRSHEYDVGVEYYFERAVVCNACRARLSLRDVMDERVFVYLTSKLVGMGRQPPTRRFTSFCFEHLKSGIRSEKTI